LRCIDVSTSFDEQSGSIDFALGQSKAKRRLGDGSRSDVKGQQGGGNQSQFAATSFCIITDTSRGK